MQRILIVFAAFNTVALLAVGVFVVHGSARSGCAEANVAAAQAWQSVAMADSGERRLGVVAASEVAVAHAAGEARMAAQRAELPWSGGEGELAAALGLALRDDPGRIELAKRATRRAHGVCGE